MAAIDDILGLPLPEIIEEISLEGIIDRKTTDLVTLFPAMAGVATLESEPSRKNIEVETFREGLIRARLNDIARSNLLPFATGAGLDALAVFYDVFRLGGETDEALRTRVISAIQGRSTGGTAPRYESIARGADVDVRSAVVYRVGTDPTVHIAIFSHSNAGVAPESVIQNVRAAVNNPAVRMVNDTIIVKRAVFMTVDVEANIWLLPESSDVVFTAAESRLRAQWETESGMGFDLTRAWLTARLMSPGVQKVEILTPFLDVVAPPDSAIALGTVTLNNMGRGY